MLKDNEIYLDDKKIADVVKLEKDTCETEAEGLFEVYRRLRPGDMPSNEAVKQHLKMRLSPQTH